MLDLGTSGTCRHCCWQIVQEVRPDGSRYWVHCGTRLPRCTTDGPATTCAEPARLEIVT